MSPSSSSLHSLSGTALGALIARGEVSSLEVTEAFLARIADLNRELQAFVYVADWQARRRARQFDVDRARGRAPTGPLAGVPIGIKDLSPVRLMPVRFGSRALGPIVSPVDDELVKRTRHAGLIILGKLATSEFGVLPFTEPDVHPPTRNPWDQGRTAGGSSGGTASAVAARLLPFGHGSDGGGSIRIPAGLCGLFGFKPSRGALPHTHPPERLKLATDGPLTHTVDDAAALLDLWARDDRFRRPTPRPAGLRIRVVTESSDQTLAPVDPWLRDAVTDVARTLEAMGHVVEPGPPVALAVGEFLMLWRKTASWVPLPRRLDSRLQAVTRWLREAGREIPDDAVFAHQQALQARIDAWFGDVDIVVTPTVASLAPAVGSWRHPDPATSFSRAVPMGAFTAAFNVSGQPGITIPVQRPGQPMPLAVQLVARRDDDARLLALARALEEARDGFDLRPSLAGC